MRTLRVEWVRPLPENVVFGLWHHDLPACMGAFRNRGITVLISASKDGEFAARVAQSLGYQVLRGSSSRRQTAVRQLKVALEQGQSVGMALDGPHGPPLQAKPGAAWLTSQTGCPAVLLAVYVKASFRIRTWDHMVIPLPFAKVKVDCVAITSE
jgi:lysophospholipid acyltransferase (LPLAT)-like uncharacterized protein